MWLLPALAHLTSHPPPSNSAGQVATDTRLWLYGQVQMIRGALRELIAAAADRAEAEVDVLLPGFTHLQPAQVRHWRTSGGSVLAWGLLRAQARGIAERGCSRVAEGWMLCSNSSRCWPPNL